MLVDDILLEICALQNTEVKNSSVKFFKDEHIVNDEFLGVKIPLIRALSRKYYKKLTLDEILKFLQNKYHEIRYFALCLLVLRAKNPKEAKEISKIYLENLKYINNWDLIDISAPYILKNAPKATILNLIKSKNLWERRVGVLSQLTKIRSGEINFFLEIATTLINDCEDLIQKPIGWLLREVGKVSPQTLENFLDQNATSMDRIALRYSIEKFNQEKRQKYLRIKKV